MKISDKSLLVALVLLSLCCVVRSTDVKYDGRSLIIDGEHRLIFSGAIHYPRSTPDMWPDLIRKAKEGGLNAIETYVFWNGHEPRPREYNFEGNFDIIRFLKAIQTEGLYAILRIGPYACAEWNFGGFPVWLRKIPGVEFRTNNQPFKDEMANFTTYIVNLVKQEKLLAPQGGPIILTQIENEYGNIMGPYGDAGKQYIQWCANFAQSLDVGVPWIMCQQGDAPQPMINTCNGYYCDDFTPNNPNSPKFWTENWIGWFKNWNSPDPHRRAEDVAFAVARFYQKKGSLMNYYMYHGGTNFGHTSGGPYITTTYDYDAPLDEYGNIRQPKYGHLKELHLVLKSMENILTTGQVNDTDLGNGLAVTKFSPANGTAGCFISNSNTSADANVTYEGAQLVVPAWSVSILPDCKQEVYNTAKISTQTSIMVKKPNGAEAQPTQLKWSWRPETLGRAARGSGASFNTTMLLDQRFVAVDDESDFLWYTTSVDISSKDLAILRVNTTGHILHAFVNGRLSGSQYAENGKYTFLFERPVKLKTGKNQIALLSATVGLQNYGSFFEQTPVGIVGGPVQLITGNTTMDLSNSTWFYRVGLDGESQKIQLDNPRTKWNSDAIRTKKPFIWYKTTFQAPPGSDPVVVDLLGMGKGEAWVNGNSLGRFWPNYTAADGCHNPCDYRGSYGPDKCQAGCGEPAQRWYHVPRQFLKPGNPNTLVLFEEAGGDPTQVNFQTVTVGTVCADVEEGKNLTLSCQGGRTISKIDFASFGDPQGTCGAYKPGGCDSSGSSDVVTKACVGQESCLIQVGEQLLGASTCSVAPRRLTIQATC